MTSSRRRQNHLAGIIAIVVAMQVIAFSDAAAKWLSMSLPLLVVIWGRFFFHALFAGVYVGVKHGARALNPALSKILLARGAALFCAVAAVAHIFVPRVRENRRRGHRAVYLQRNHHGRAARLLGLRRPPGCLLGCRLRPHHRLRHHRRPASSEVITRSHNA